MATEKTIFEALDGLMIPDLRRIVIGYFPLNTIFVDVPQDTLIGLIQQGSDHTVLTSEGNVLFNGSALFKTGTTPNEDGQWGKLNLRSHSHSFCKQTRLWRFEIDRL